MGQAECLALFFVLDGNEEPGQVPSYALRASEGEIAEATWTLRPVRRGYTVTNRPVKYISARPRAKPARLAPLTTLAKPPWRSWWRVISITT